MDIAVLLPDNLPDNSIANRYGPPRICATSSCRLNRPVRIAMKAHAERPNVIPWPPIILAAALIIGVALTILYPLPWARGMASDILQGAGILLAMTATALYVTGGALVAGGVVLAILLGRDRTDASVSVSTVVPTRTIRNATRRGVMTRTLIRRARSENGVISP